MVALGYFRTKDGMIVNLFELTYTQTRDSVYSSIKMTITARGDLVQMDRLFNAVTDEYPEGTIYFNIPESLDRMIIEGCAVTSFHNDIIEFYATGYKILSSKTEIEKEIPRSRLFYILHEKAQILSEEQNK